MATQNENLQDAKAGGERIAKVIARSGLCSRREAEALIEHGHVSVNGALIDSAALDILPSDKVLVDGEPLAAREPPRLWRYHKPKGRVTTHKDPEGRPTVFEALPENLPRLISVGRLDFNTEGLLLLTNDGDLARHLELPSTGWTRRYRVRAYGQVSDAQLQELADGLTINRMNYGPIEASLEREQGDNVWISVSIREGKNREVRQIMEHLGLTVNRLIRISFGPFMLGELEPGQVEEVKTAVLKDQLGPRLTRQLGVRREPMREERRLAPGRAKPTYLRRKPAAAERPRFEPEERPLKRRRVLPMDGSEAPKVEYVSERKPRQDRFGGKEDQAGRPNREGRDERPGRAGGERPPRREGPDRRGAASSADRPAFVGRAHGAAERGRDRPERAPFRKRPEGEASARPRFDRKERGDSPSGAERQEPDRGGGARLPFAPRLDATTEDAHAERTFRPAPVRGTAASLLPERFGRPSRWVRRPQAPRADRGAATSSIPARRRRSSRRVRRSQAPRADRGAATSSIPARRGRNSRRFRRPEAARADRGTAAPFVPARRGRFSWWFRRPQTARSDRGTSAPFVPARRGGSSQRFRRP